MPDLNREEAAEQDLRAFFGRNADYYLERWRQSEVSGRGDGKFNWAAFLLSGFWLSYRKMYAATAIFIGVILLETMVEDWYFTKVLGKPDVPAAVGSVVGLVAALICGAFGNRWYLAHARRRVAEVQGGRTIA